MGFDDCSTKTYLLRTSSLNDSRRLLGRETMSVLFGGRFISKPNLLIAVCLPLISCSLTREFCVNLYRMCSPSIYLLFVPFPFIFAGKYAVTIKGTPVVAGPITFAFSLVAWLAGSCLLRYPFEQLPVTFVVRLHGRP